MDKAQIKEWYGNGLTDAQLDGKGANPSSTYATRNYVALGVLTQAEAEEIRALNEPHADAQHNLKSGGISRSTSKDSIKIKNRRSLK